MALHPFFATTVSKSVGNKTLSSGTPEDARSMVAAGRATLGSGPDMSSVEQVTIDSRGGPLSARILIPYGKVVGVVVYLHGGGWVVGSIDDFDTLARALAERTGCAVVLPDYRLAPEHPFPAALEDAEDAIQWVAESRTKYFGDALPMVIAGDSAGANLATVAARRLAAEVELALQVLIYPVTSADFDSASYLDASDGMPLTRQDMRWFFSHYAPEEAWSRPDVTPASATDLAILPPAAIVTAEHDVLRSDGCVYARALQEAGVQVSYRQYSGMVHGFVRLHNNLDIADAAVTDISESIVQAINSGPS